MTDLRTCAASMAEMIEHLIKFEGAIDHFYCDHRGLVTIAVGALVDRAGASDQTRLSVAREFASRTYVEFHSGAGNQPASTDDVLADWLRVREFGKCHHNHRARSYSSVAKLRLAQSSVEAVTAEKVDTYAATLYTRRSFLAALDPHVTMALVDCRYNPAGVRLFGSEMNALWACLGTKHHDPELAIELFTSMWDGRGGEAYQRRHQQRIAWMREGLRPPSSAVS